MISDFSFEIANSKMALSLLIQLKKLNQNVVQDDFDFSFVAAYVNALLRSVIPSVYSVYSMPIY